MKESRKSQCREEKPVMDARASAQVVVEMANDDL